MSMLVSVKELKKYWGVCPTSLVHVGAHDAEELEQYEKAGWNQVTWIEAQPSKIDNLKRRLPNHHKLIQAAVWHVDGESLNLNIMSNTESTSLFQLGTHAIQHPTVKLSEKIIVSTVTLGTLLKDELTPELISLDIQGAELNALRGFGDRINEVKWIYCEVNREELYKGCCLVSELDEYLGRRGFKRALTKWTEHGWGDALYVNKANPKSTQKLKDFALRTRWDLMNLTRELKQSIIIVRESLKA